MLDPKPGTLGTPNADPMVPTQPKMPQINVGWFLQYVHVKGGEFGSNEKGGDGIVIPGVVGVGVLGGLTTGVGVVGVVTGGVMTGVGVVGVVGGAW